MKLTTVYESESRQVIRQEMGNMWVYLVKRNYSGKWELMPTTLNTTPKYLACIHRCTPTTFRTELYENGKGGSVLQMVIESKTEQAHIQRLLKVFG